MIISVLVQIFFIVAILGFRIYLYVISRQDTNASVDRLLKFTNRFLLFSSILTFIGLMMSLIGYISMQLSSEMMTMYSKITSIASQYVLLPLGVLVTVYFIAGIYMSQEVSTND